MRIKLTATVPVVQYGNIIPEIEVEADTYEEALQIAEGRLRDIWNRYVEKGKELPDGNRKILKAFVGGEVGYDEVTHTYSNPDNPTDIYLSGSVYAEKFKPVFDKERIALAVAKKHKVKPEDVIAMWELKGQASRDLGSALHAALQLEEQYRGLGKTLGKPSLHGHSIFKTCVESFIKDHKDEQALNEVLVVDHKAKRAGRIDRLVITTPNHCIIEDFKTGETVKDLEYYWKQLEFYGGIVEAGGWKVDKLKVHHYNGVWKEYIK